MIRAFNRIYFAILCLVFLLGSSEALRGQDPIYSQYYHAPLTINPAFAGRTYGPFFSVNYRNQWPGINNAYETFSFNYDQFLPSKNSGIGIGLDADEAAGGTLRTITAKFAYAYRLTWNDDHHLKIGLETGVLNSRLNWDKLVFADQIDPRYGFQTPGGGQINTSEQSPEQLTDWRMDIGTGVLLSTPIYYVGFAAKHINSPEGNIVFDNQENTPVGIPTRFTLHGGFTYELRKGNKKQFPTLLNPSVLYLKQGSFAQLSAGAHIDFGVLLVGLHYRHANSNSDAVIGMVGIRHGIYKIGYSFDYTVSKLNISAGGSHEIGVSINLDHLYERPSKYNDCLKLFR